MKDLTKGNILTGLIAFTLPLLMGNFFQVLYNTADTLIVGQTLGKDALASVGADWLHQLFNCRFCSMNDSGPNQF